MSAVFEKEKENPEKTAKLRSSHHGRVNWDFAVITDLSWLGCFSKRFGQLDFLHLPSLITNFLQLKLNGEFW